MTKMNEYSGFKYNIIGCKFSISEIQNYKDELTQSIHIFCRSRTEQGKIGPIFIDTTTSLELVCL